MGSAIDPIDDDIAGSCQFILEAAINEAAEDVRRALAVNCEVGDAARLTLPIERPMHRFDDVSAFAQRPKSCLGVGCDGPLRGANLIGDAEALQMLGTADRSEEHTSELQSLMRISYSVFCLKKK